MKFAKIFEFDGEQVLVRRVNGVDKDSILFTIEVEDGTQTEGEIEIARGTNAQAVFDAIGEVTAREMMLKLKAMSSGIDNS